MHPEDIKASVRKRGTTLTKLAMDNGLSDSACRKALTVPVPRADRAIAACIGKPLHVIWPQRYDRAGNRKFTKVNSTDLRASAHRLSAGAQ